MRKVLGAFALLVSANAWSAIPATPVMTVYQFNGPMDVPYYDADRFARSGKTAPAGTLTQGTSVIPCLVIRNGKPLTDSQGTPYVGFEVVVDPRRATPASTEAFKRAVAERKGLKVRNHHCPAGVRNVINVRELYALEKAPFFDPQASGRRSPDAGQSQLDGIVRAFHASSDCADVNRRLTGRRQALERAWDAFIRQRSDLGSPTTLARAKHLDYAMRTALYEGHLGRGCSAYGACERNIVVLSIRNRAVGQCQRGQGCGFPGDFQGASSSVSQYNIWDEYLTQISGLTSCFLRPDLASNDYYAKIQTMYAQTVPDAEQILYGGDQGLRAVFPGNSLSDLTTMRHYYHAPAMGKCFPKHDRVEYMTGAVASSGGDYALIANTRVQVGSKSGSGYSFKEFLFEEAPDRDIVSIRDNYPGFLIDARKVSLRKPSSCPAYGIPSGCRSAGTGRYRKVPSWLSAGKPVEINCRVVDRGESCRGGGSKRSVSVGGTCDKEMRPVARVP
ncbi:hypothetical protein G3480_09220 [Thiorhodococcus mannitoliphagus]|uniref:Uncharacterized protein n=1 Tax=Thiorhodococcus mannitoliphagus TaxID=329406 RepID=A0A6P1DQD2_9GAMM|nr:hypothetical protein [Thiorhodococcus mannitoliphagus]NEX20487.1 hypothetical protein [Thiorhodococcus mannitoliphagus]